MKLQEGKDVFTTPAAYKCLVFERALWFQLHKTMWTKSHDVFSAEQDKRYIGQNISKLY